MKKISATRPLPSQGFTLIEVMVTVAIVGIIAAIAIPSYNAQVTKTRRADAKNCLVDAAQRQEDFFYTNNSYTTTLANLGFASASAAVSCGDDANYTLTAAAGGSGIGSSYLLTATRANAQVGDTQCGDLTLSSTGVKGESGTLTAADCW